MTTWLMAVEEVRKVREDLELDGGDIDTYRSDLFTNVDLH